MIRRRSASSSGSSVVEGDQHPVELVARALRRRSRRSPSSGPRGRTTAAPRTGPPDSARHRRTRSAAAPAEPPSRAARRSSLSRTACCSSRRASARWPRSAARSGLHDDHLDGQDRLQLVSPQLLGQLERRLRTTERPFAVGHHRQVVVGPGHPAQGPELLQGDAPMPGRVRRLGRRLPDHGQSRRPTPGRLGVSVGELRVVVDQLAGRDQVAGDDLLQLLRQAAELGPHRPVQRRGCRRPQAPAARRPASAGPGAAGCAPRGRAPRRRVSSAAPGRTRRRERSPDRRPAGRPVDPWGRRPPGRRPRSRPESSARPCPPACHQPVQRPSATAAGTTATAGSAADEGADRRFPHRTILAVPPAHASGDLEESEHREASADRAGASGSGHDHGRPGGTSSATCSGAAPRSVIIRSTSETAAEGTERVASELAGDDWDQPPPRGQQHSPA